jgi:hypothetical protein
MMKAVLAGNAVSDSRIIVDDKEAVLADDDDPLCMEMQQSAGRDIPDTDRQDRRACTMEVAGAPLRLISK